jgi:hypothetical protein
MAWLASGTSDHIRPAHPMASPARGQTSPMTAQSTVSEAQFKPSENRRAHFLAAHAHNGRQPNRTTATTAHNENRPRRAEPVAIPGLCEPSPRVAVPKSRQTHVEPRLRQAHTSTQHLQTTFSQDHGKPTVILTQTMVRAAQAMASSAQFMASPGRVQPITWSAQSIKKQPVYSPALGK